jgi:hypothetical protein
MEDALFEPPRQQDRLLVEDDFFAGVAVDRVQIRDLARYRSKFEFTSFEATPKLRAPRLSSAADLPPCRRTCGG